MMCVYFQGKGYALIEFIGEEEAIVEKFKAEVADKGYFVEKYTEELGLKEGLGEVKKEEKHSINNRKMGHQNSQDNELDERQ